MKLHVDEYDPQTCYADLDESESLDLCKEKAVRYALKHDCTTVEFWLAGKSYIASCHTEKA